MSLHRLKTMLFGAALTLTAIGFAAPSQASADFEVRVDCTGLHNSPLWAGSKDTVSIYVQMTDGTWWLLASDELTDSECRFGWEELVGTTRGYRPHHINRIMLHIDGSDAFFVDKVSLIEHATGFRRDFGVDNTKGWCLSTDPKDGNNSFCSSAARPTLSFYPNG